MSSISKLIKADAATFTNRMLVTDFFTDNNPNGYGTKAEWKEHLNDDENNNRFEPLLVLMSEGVPFNNFPTVLIDKKDGHEFTFIRPVMAKGNPPILIKLVGRLINFFIDYQMGKINPGFTLAQLYEEACRS